MQKLLTFFQQKIFNDQTFNDIVMFERGKEITLSQHENEPILLSLINR